MPDLIMVALVVIVCFALARVYADMCDRLLVPPR